jgi:hypothetical protein
MLEGRGVGAAEAQAHVAQLVELKRQAEQGASAVQMDRSIQQAMAEEQRKHSAVKKRNTIAWGVVFLCAGVGSCGFGLLALSVDEGRPVGSKLLGLGMGMMTVGGILLVTGLRQKR